MYFDRNGRPIETLDYCQRFETVEYKRIAWDPLPGGGHLSTVWLGLDHSYGDGPPLIFETMAFGADGFAADDICERYPTEAEARQGHARILAELLSAPPATPPPMPPPSPGDE